jgi:uncharacterized membrane protein
MMATTPLTRSAAPERRALPAAVRQRLGIGVLTLAALVFYLWHSLGDQAGYLTTGYDLGIFDQAVRAYAHFQAPIVPLKGVDYNIFGDHFHPIIVVLAPLYWIWDNPDMLLIAQSVLIAASIPVVYRFVRRRAGEGMSLLITAAYAFGWPVQGLIDFDFHEIAFAVPLVACSLSALSRGKVRAAAVWALPLVFVKEDQGFTVAAIGLLIVVMSRGRDRADGPDRAAMRCGALLTAWGLAWSFLAIAVIIPHFNPLHQYPYWADGGVLSPGGAHPSPPSVLAQLGHSYLPKLRTTLLILLPVAFVALGSPLTLVAVPGLALRFVSTNPAYWGAGYHYNATVMPIVFLGAIDTLARTRAYRARPAGEGEAGARPWFSSWVDPAATRILPALMLGIAVVTAWPFPLSDLWHAQTYQISPHVRGEDAALARVPAGTTVEATLAMLAPLAARDDTYWIGVAGNPAPRYVVFDDLDSGWNPPPSDPLTFVEQRHPGVTYREIYENNFVYVFRRAGQTGP